jgi:peptidoglycan endopeptidase LytE
MVKSGDTLFAIALRFHTTVDAILTLNPQITNANLIRVGDILNIPQ